MLRSLVFGSLVVVLSLVRGTGAGLVAHGAPHQAAPSHQTEAAKRYADLMKSARGRNSDAAVVVPQLEQFIRDYPEYPDLDQIYSVLLRIVLTRNPERVNGLADEFLAKFPDSRYRAAVYDAKFTLLTAKHNDSGIQTLGLEILQTETRPDVLDNAADYDTTHALHLLDRAIAGRRKNLNQSEAPTLLDLRWSYAKSLHRAGRYEESFESAVSVIDDTVGTLEKLEREADDRNRSEIEYLKDVLQDRYAAFIGWCSDGGRRDLALRYLERQEKADAPTDRPSAERTRGELYGRLGVFDRAVDCFVRAFAERMDRGTYDSIIALAGKSGRDPAGFLARARTIRTAAAVPAYRFDLKTDSGGRLKLSDIKAKVILLNFFFPT